MGKCMYFLLLLLLMSACVCGKRSGGGSSWGRRGSSRGKSSGSSTSSGGWFSWGKTSSSGHASVPAAAPKPAPAAPSYGWQNPSYNPPPKPAGSSYSRPSPAKPASNPSQGWHFVPSPKQPSNSWQAASKPASPSNWQTAPKPVTNNNWQTASRPASPSGWQNPSHNPALKPASSNTWQGASKPATYPSHASQNPSHVPAKPSAPPLPSKPVATVPLQNSNPASKLPGTGAQYGWSSPGQVKPAGTNIGQNKPASNLPSSNIGPGGYPVQSGVQRPSGPGHVNPPPYSATNPHGTSTLNQGRVAPPGYSASNPHTSYGNGGPPAYNSGGTSYSGPKKQIINNHYHYNSPPAYSPSHYGMNSHYNPPQNSFGYPSGGFFGSSRPSYGGMGLFSGSSGYGYPGSGSWGGYSSYGSSNNGGMVKGLLIGAAGGYLANSLIRRVTNPWGYSGSGYGHGYSDRYRYDDRNYPSPPPPATPAPPAPHPSDNWVNCVAYDPVTRTTLINPNCTCTVSTTTDQVTGQNISHHDCTPLGQPPSMIPSPPLPIWGVNNPPPSFNGSLYGDGAAYGGYGGSSYGQPSAGQFGPGQSPQYPTPGVPPGDPAQYSPPAEPPLINPSQLGAVQPAETSAQYAPSQSTPPEAEVPKVQEAQIAQVSQVPLTKTEESTPVAVTTTITPDMPVSEAIVGDADTKRREFYSQLQGLVNMGRFVDR